MTQLQHARRHGCRGTCGSIGAYLSFHRKMRKAASTTCSWIPAFNTEAWTFFGNAAMVGCKAWKSKVITKGAAGTIFSNSFPTSKKTPGCFLYTEADFYLYAFLDTQEIHVLPMPSTRAWFLPLAKNFSLKHVPTHQGPIRYTTVGAIITVKRVLNEVPGAKKWGQATFFGQPRLSFSFG